MAKYEITYVCGHTGTVELFGKTKERDKKIAWMEKSCYCPECEAVKRREKIAEEEKKNKETSLPYLTGTEKQIVWANKIRNEFLDSLEEFRARIETDAKAAYEANKAPADKIDAEYEKAMSLMNETKKYLISHNCAHWWIDNRHNGISHFLRETQKWLEEKHQPSSDKTDEAVSAKAEATVIPDNQKYQTTAEITAKEECVEIRSEKDDVLRSIVKNLDYSWDSNKRCWSKAINSFTGASDDRSAEIGNKLLCEGFPIVVYDENIREKAISADFEPECTRWIKMRVSGEYEGWLSITWKGKDQNIYDAARKIHGSRWSSPNVVVPIESYKEVEDFADIMGFKISAGVLKAIATYKESLRPKVTPTTPTQQKQPDKLKEILQSSDDVIPSLKDE